MAFSVARVEVRDPESATPYVSKDITDLSEIKGLVDMNRSYMKDPDAKRQVLTAYEYNIKLVRNGYEFTAEYTSPSEMEVFTRTTESGLFIGAKLTYKRATGELHIKRLNVTFNMDVYTEAPSDAEVARKMAGALAMFRIVRDIAPLVVGEKLKPSYTVVGHDTNYDFHKDSKTLKEKAKKSAAYKAAAMEQLADFNLLARL